MPSTSQVDRSNAAIEERLTGRTDLPDVLYLVYREALGSVFQSMVVRPLGDLRRLGYPTRLLAFAPLGEFLRPSRVRCWRPVREAILQEFGGPFTRLPSPPSRFRKCWDEGLVLRQFFRRQYGRDRSVVVHCRGPYATMLAVRLRDRCPRVRVLFDVRGFLFAEQLYDRGVFRWEDCPGDVAMELRPLRALEQSAARQADHVICVSPNMAARVATDFQVPHEKLSVVWNHVPCLRFDQGPGERKAIRRNLGLTDRFVVVYAGSLYPRQRFRQGLQLLRHIKVLEPTAHLLALTSQVETVQQLVQEEGIARHDVTIHSVEHSGIARMLAAGDIGLITTGLLQPHSLANEVCCPVKFAEYLASGLPVVMSDGIGNCSELALQNRLGLVVLSDADESSCCDRLRGFLEAYRASPDAWRDRCRQTARTYLDSSIHPSKVVDLYHQLSAPPT